METFDVEALGGCSNDFLVIWNGLSEDSPLLGKFCGSGPNIPATFQSTQSKLHLRYEFVIFSFNQGFFISMNCEYCKNKHLSQQICILSLLTDSLQVSS